MEYSAKLIKYRLGHGKFNFSDAHCLYCLFLARQRKWLPLQLLISPPPPLSPLSDLPGKEVRPCRQAECRVPLAPLPPLLGLQIVIFAVAGGF